MNWHLTSKKEALQLTGSRPQGLTTSEAQERLAKYGRNELQEKNKRPAWLLFLGQFKDMLILILLAAAVVAGLIGDFKDSLVILFIVVLNAVVGFVQEHRAERAMAALKKMAAPLATTLRNGAPTEIPAAELTPGDIVLLEAGDMTPADLRLLETHSLKIEEASLTGEPIAVEKQTAELHGEQLPLGDRNNMAYKGTLVAYGRGTGVVVATGMETEIGRMAQLLQEDESLTPLQKRLGDFGKKLSLVVLGISVGLYVAGLLRGEDPVRMLLTVISVAVAAIPEGLPIVVTIALALGAARMVRKNALVRKLPAVETLGSVTYICSDKTGTLTQNRMTVVETWTPQTPVAGLAFSPQETLLRCMALNHDVQKNEAGEWTGESTEVGLASFAAQQLTDFQPAKRVGELPFDSGRKMMTTVHEWKKGQFLVVTKGALESILAACDDPDEKALTAAAGQMGQQGLRVIAYGCKLLNRLPAKLDFSSLETGLQAVGLAGLTDPPREEAAAAIAECKSAGIVPVMITGDHPATAAAIARQLGILENATQKTVTGAELQAMQEADLERDVERIRVYARVSPEQKLRIVKALQRKGHFVAVTGDGVNDAPALRRANIGVAMGVTGTDVSKEAAHMILLDDNFSTIVKAVQAGRHIYTNIRKFIRFNLAGNSGQVWTIILAALAGLPIPLLPIQILWVNLVVDGLPALALANEPVEKDLMQEPPRKPEESIFAHGLGLNVLFVGLLIGIICVAVQAWAVAHDDPKWQTYVFVVLCFSQLGNVLAIRSEKNSFFSQRILSNPALIGSVLLTMLMQLALLYVPFLREIFSTHALTWQELLGCTAVSTLVFFAVEAAKLVGKWRERKHISEKQFNR